MNVSHFSMTPLAGAPLRIVQALNTSGRFKARLVDLKDYGPEDFGHDIVFSDEPDLAYEVASQADIIHLHNYLHYGSQEFWPIDFESLKRRGTLFIRQFHSDPDVVARVMGVTKSELMRQDIPALVVAQFQEREYPGAMVVPNMIPQNDPLYMPLKGQPSNDIFFSPTIRTGAWKNRWNTKGWTETENIISAVCIEKGASYRCIHKTPLPETLAVKQSSRIVVDEMVTGSYHLTGLEGLSQAKPVLAYLDDRTRWIMSYFSGTGTCPFINVRLEDAHGVMAYLLDHRDEAEDIGRASRLFVERHWSQAEQIKHIEAAYEKLALDPRGVERQKDLSVEGVRSRFFAYTLPDLIYHSRKKRVER